MNREIRRFLQETSRRENEVIKDRLPVDRGLTLEESEKIISGLRKIAPDLSTESITDVERVLGRQYPYAVTRDTEAKRIGRREFIGNLVANTIIGGAFVSGAGGLFFGGKWLADHNSEFNSPEKKAEREAEKQAKEKAELLKRKEDEDKLTLGLTPTAISKGGYRFYYPKREANVRYEFEKKADVWGSENEVAFTKKNALGDGTLIRLKSYRRIDGKVVPAISFLPFNKDFREIVYLRDEPTEQIDNRVVIFEDTISKETQYWRVEFGDLKGSRVDFNLSIMRRVQS